MTLRKELYETALKVKEEKKLEEERDHYPYAECYLKNLCKKAAEKGEFEVVVKRTYLEDNKPLSEADIKKFASCYDLDFKYDTNNTTYVTLPVLSFDTSEKNNK